MLTLQRNMVGIAVAIGVLVILAGGAWMFLRGGGAGTVLPSGDEGQSPSLPSPEAVTVRALLRDMPQGPTVVIGTPRGNVVVRNFYLENPPLEEGDVILLKTETHHITYSLGTSSFWVAVRQKPFTIIRPIAEQAFLEILGITNDDACKLRVEVGTLYGVDPAIDGKSFPLSFCTKEL